MLYSKMSVSSTILASTCILLFVNITEAGNTNDTISGDSQRCKIKDLTPLCDRHFKDLCENEGLYNLYWGEIPPECQEYWTLKSIDMLHWDKDSFWDELPPQSQRYWIEEMGLTEEEWEMENFDWQNLPKERQNYYKRRGWNQNAWDVGEESLKTFINEEELDWDELPTERLQYWIERGYDKQKWDSGDDCAGLEKKGRIFNPMKLKVSIPQLESITIDTLAEFDTEVGLRDGYTKDDNESYIGMAHIKDYIKELRSGTRRYLAMEDLDPYKKAFEEKIGGGIYQYLYHALNSSVELKEKGIFTPNEWNSEHYDWAMFVGSKGTSTSMHYDNDLFNFLWVSEGRKRIILIPNDERTEGKFEIVSAFSGTAHTGLDILDRSKPLPEHAEEIEIGPGEGIYFPYMCWHAVENLEDTLAFGWRVKDGY